MNKTEISTERIARLAKLSESEGTTLKKDFSDMLAFASRIKKQEKRRELREDIENILREDRSSECLDRREVLMNAKKNDGAYICVPRRAKEEE